MPFNQKLQKFNAKINTVTIGSGDKTVTIGGDSTYPFYSFDAPSENTPKIGVEISDMGLENVVSEGIKAYYDGASTIGEMAKKAAAMEGADFLCLRLAGGDPNGLNKSVEELIETVKEVADAVDVPLVVEGCKNVEKDSELLTKVAEVLQGRNVLVMSAREEDYKAVGAAAGLAYSQKVGAESAVDINLAKQLNVEKTVVLGYRTSTFLKDEFEAVGDVVISTEDGSFGTKGNVIDAIKEQGVEGSIIYACGPTPMLRGIKAYAEEMGIEAQISMEERMACGIGACLACVCKSKDVDSHSHVHNKRVCKDGPVFDAREVEL